MKKSFFGVLIGVMLAFFSMSASAIIDVRNLPGNRIGLTLGAVQDMVQNCTGTIQRDIFTYHMQEVGDTCVIRGTYEFYGRTEEMVMTLAEENGTVYYSLFESGVMAFCSMIPTADGGALLLIWLVDQYGGVTYGETWIFPEQLLPTP